MIRAILFDFDGLILDTETPDCQAWQEVFQQHGCTLSVSDWADGIGRGADGIGWNPYEGLEAQLGRPVDRLAIRALRRQRVTALVEEQEAMPGVVELLEEARKMGIRVGIASSSPRAWVEGWLQHLGLADAFDAIICAEDVERTKPDPALYLRVLDVLGVDASEAVVLEDSPNGVLAAKRAGICCVAVPNAMTRELCFDHADLCVESLAGIGCQRLWTLAGGGQ